MPLASKTAAYTLIGFATKFQDYFRGEAGDVTFKYMNSDDSEVKETTVPNVAKLSQLFGNQYLGPKDDKPTTRNDGTDLEQGDLFYYNSDKMVLVYDGKDWKPIADYREMATSSFTGDGDTKEFTVDGGYAPNKGIVFINGSDNTPNADITDGEKIKFDDAPKDGDEIVAYFFNAVNVNDAISTSGGVSKGDIEISQSDKGFILVDRNDANKKYRLYVEDGNLGLEEV